MPIRYIPYTPNTVEGQALLDNFSRTRRVLRYRDNDKVYDRIKRGMPYYEIENLEQIGDNKANLVIRGESISACAYLKEQNIKVDLVYIDPPFASGADYAKKVYIRRNPKLAEKIAQAEQEMDNSELQVFDEKMYGDIWEKEDYLNWMYENLQAIKSIMSDTASIYVHLDWHIGHYVKIIMDEVFGENNFLNEIVWLYNERESSINYYNRKHDTIYFYSLNEKYVFNPNSIRDDYSETTIKKFKYTDDKGNKYRLRYKDGRNDPIKEDENTYRQYLDKDGGTLPKDWFKMPIVNQASNERADYSTQKPEALLERIIKASSNEGMVVADFFGGSGVTAKVANDLGRKFIHVDIGINSIQTTRDRLTAAGAEFQIMEIKDGVNLFRNPVQTMDKLAQLILGLQQKITGINSFWFGAIQDSKQGIVPVYVPNLLDSREKILDIPLINKIVNQELQHLDISAKQVIVYYIDIMDYREIEQFIKENNATEIKVELKDLKNLLHDIVIEDIIEYSLNTATDDDMFTTEQYQLSIDKFISDRLMLKISEFNEKGTLQSINKGRKFNPIRISDSGLELIELISVDCTNTTGIWHSDSEIKIDKLGYITVNGNKTKAFWDGSITSKKPPLRLKIRNISGDETILAIK